MPYNGIPDDKTAKMDSCVGRVQKTGRSKDSAVAICHDSVMGKKRKEVENYELLSDEDTEKLIEETLEAWSEEHEKEQNIVERVVSAVKSLLHKETPDEQSPMMIWKEESGQYRWIARYSNNFRDDDNPPEIISDASHRRFVDMVDKGAYPLPQLWLWHRPEWKIGQATAVAYDDNGFAVAAGYFDKGKEYYAEWLSKQKNVAVSHAMPPSSIARDTQDPSVIVEHQTVEISPLPLWAAANKRTGFIVVQEALKEADMAIPQKKRDSLVNDWGMDPALLESLEKQNAADAEKAVTEGVESKEQSEQVASKEEGQVESETETVAETTTEETPVAATNTEAVAAVDQPPSRQEIADAFGTILGELKEAMTQIAERMVTMENEVKELKDAETARVEKSAQEVPAASLSALLAHRMIGRQETAVDGRSSLAKSKPKEADDASSTGKTGIPFVDRMISGNE